MRTRCPFCSTAFRITPDQLAHRQGRVRCGRCRNVFNALDSLLEEEAWPVTVISLEPAPPVQPVAVEPLPPVVPEPVQVPSEPVPEPAAVVDQPAQDQSVEGESVEGESAEGEPAEERVAEAGLAKEDWAAEHPVADETVMPKFASPELSPPEPIPEPIEEPIEEPPTADLIDNEVDTEGPEGLQDEAVVEAAQPSQPPSQEQPESPPEEAVAGNDLSPEPPPEAPLPKPAPEVDPDEAALESLLQEAPRRRWPWVLGSLLALLGLLLQGVYTYRVELGTTQPEARATLASLCAVLGCDMPLPRDARLVDIESSDLNPDSAAGRLRLQATLRNRADFAQELPSLELTLTDNQDRALARRVLAPADYLPAKSDRGAGLAAQSVLAVNLLVEAGGVSASGYRLYLFYP